MELRKEPDFARIMPRKWVQDYALQRPLLLQNYAPYDLYYLQFPALKELDCVSHMFTTRLGGVSEGFLSSLNLNWNKGDDPEKVAENFRRVSEVFSISPSRITLSMQTHTTNLRMVTAEDAGKGVTKEQDYSDIDGLFTNVPGILLGTSYADCVPLYFVDPVHKAIGLAHAGWKGTVNQIGIRMVEAMRDAYNSNPAELICAIGPSICMDCYEVSGDVAEAFAALEAQEGAKTILADIYASGYRGGYDTSTFEFDHTQMLSEGKEPGKYQLDLWAANYLNLRLAGVLHEHISLTDICTCHNPAYLFSHRATKGNRGNLHAFMMLK